MRSYKKAVKFKHLAYVVIDEQHRFGTLQRQKLTRKEGLNPPFTFNDSYSDTENFGTYYLWRFRFNFIGPNAGGKKADRDRNCPARTARDRV